MSEEKKIGLDEAFEKLDELLEQLESPETTLEESFVKYKEGVELLKACHETIDAVEKQVLILNENGEFDELQ